MPTLLQQCEWTTPESPEQRLDRVLRDIEHAERVVLGLRPDDRALVLAGNAALLEFGIGEWTKSDAPGPSTNCYGKLRVAEAAK